jgi:hypothetical protein
MVSTCFSFSASIRILKDSMSAVIDAREKLVGIINSQGEFLNVKMKYVASVE